MTMKTSVSENICHYAFHRGCPPKDTSVSVANETAWSWDWKLGNCVESTFYPCDSDAMEEMKWTAKWDLAINRNRFRTRFECLSNCAGE